ncbi:MAG: ParB/RepB/Spo0J family partition protein [Candidatus Omnitrophica bacterium]|jgi:ParB family chromosome partitioning protein|nr:ParB/RepB/Spo0J family partition protein [Candidatus Omnitrophota bacterium]MDD5080029.1 ParB/RepB/Spo0J family partition protein [Candidatus Omnitrophota bacterium]
MERKALGKGISALIPATEEVQSKKIAFLDLAKVKPNPLQPREDFDPESMAELVQSIKEKGLLQPILVRPKGDNYELIAGERRLRAANLLNLKEIPAIIKDVEDRDSLELALIENIQRQELNPIEEARAYQYLIEKFRLTQEEVGDVLGKSRVTITNSLRLLKLPGEIQEEVRSGRISYAHGRALLEIEDANMQRKLVRDIISKSLSVRELESIIKTRRPLAGRVRIGARSKNIDPQVVIMEEQLQQALATKVRVVKNKKRGHIVVEFYSQEDLERIVSKMRGETKL